MCGDLALSETERETLNSFEAAVLGKDGRSNG